MFLLWLFAGFATLHLSKTNRKPMPEATRQGLQNAKTLAEFEHYAALDNSTDMMADFYRNQYNVSNRCDLNETCILVPVCVPIEPDPNNKDSEYFPRCVKLTRCVESSHDHDKHCHETIDSVNVTVLHFHHIENGRGIRQIRNLQKENHTSCFLQTGSPPGNNHVAKRATPPPTSTTSLTPPINSKCTSFNQCGNPDGVKEQKRDDCNECEVFESDCCSCLCQYDRDDDGICTCPDDEK